jgi:hypothetical protein
MKIRCEVADTDIIKLETVPVLTCEQINDLLDNHYADHWEGGVDLREVVDRHLSGCPACYSKLVDIEIGFEAALRAAVDCEPKRAGLFIRD